MLLGNLSSVVSRTFSFTLSSRGSRLRMTAKLTTSQMVQEDSHLIPRKKPATFRLCNVSGYETDLLEIRAENPKMHVLFIPGNPGVISFYTDFLESLYQLLGGTASVTGHHCLQAMLSIMHCLHNNHIYDTFCLPYLENWEHGSMFSLEEQISHKMEFIKQELENANVPIILVGHSIGAYICITLFQRYTGKVIYCVGLYPFLKVDPKSSTQSIIKQIAASSTLRATISSIVAFLGLLPNWVSQFLVKKSAGMFWSSTAIEAFCTHVLQYHTMQNVLFMAFTEFRKLSESPDWAFMRDNQTQVAFLFGLDDHWGPMRLYEEIAKQVPNAALTIEREGHTHSFSCTEAGSLWVAQHVASLLSSQKIS